MELITDKEELGNIDSEEVTLLRNKEHLLNMLPHYEFNEESEKRIIDAINNPPSLDFMGIPLNPNSQRAFFKLSEEDKKELIEEIKETNEAEIKYHTRGMTEEVAKLKRITHCNQISLENDAIKAVVQSSRYLVVSRNPIDIIFCSTNQNYGSCYAFNSEYGACFGVPALIPNKDMFVCYLTKGKHQNYDVKEHEGDTYSFRFMKMLTRFFAYHCFDYERNNEDDIKKDQVGLGYVYPKNGGTFLNHDDIRFGYFGNLFKKLGLKVIEPSKELINQEIYPNVNRFKYNTNGEWRLKTPKWFLAKEKVNDNYMNPYFDNVWDLATCEPKYSINYGAKTEHTNYMKGGATTSIYTKIIEGKTLEKIIGKEYEMDDCCDEDDENARCCSWCENYFDEDNMYWIEGRQDYVCRNCYDNNFFCCDACDERYHNDDEYSIYEITRGEREVYRTVCDDCRSDYYYCDECNEWFTRGSTVGTAEGYVCNNCFEEIYEECSCCGEIFCRKEDMKTNFKGESVCPDCYKGKMTKLKSLRYTQRIEFQLPSHLYDEVLNSHKKDKIISTNLYCKEAKTIIIKRHRENGRYYNTVITINWEG